MRKETVEHQEVFTRLQGLEQQLESVKQHDYKQIENLHTYLDELDRRRGTNWGQLFPYLDIHE